MSSKQDRAGVRTAQDLEQKYNLSSISIIKKAVEKTALGLVSTNNELTSFIEATTKNFEEIQNQVDGNLTTWFYSGVPTTSNLPASEWTTYEDKVKHVGDLYYDKDTGYAYRWFQEGDEFAWVKMSDSDVTEALAIANAALDTADSKRRVFVVQPTPPYDVGDIWFRNNEDLYRCATARESGAFNASDFVIATKYTDDTVANEAKAIANELKTTIETHYVTNAKLETTKDSINSSVEKLALQVDEKNKVFTTKPTPPYYVGDVYVLNDKIYYCTTERTTGSYNESDWELSVDAGTLVSKTEFTQTSDSFSASIKGLETDLSTTNSNLDETNSNLATTNSNLDETNSNLETTNSNLSKTDTKAQNALDKANTNTNDIKVLKQTDVSLQASLDGIEASVEVLDNDYQTTKTTRKTATGNPTYISDSGGYALEKDFIYGMSIQETRSGKNLYNINDVYNRANAFISIDSDDWIKLTRDNSSGTSVSYVNNYVNPSELLKVDTNYYIIFEVKEVSGTGSINVTSLQATNAKGQFTTTNGYKLANLKAGDVKKITATTLSDFSSCITMLRNFATFQAGEGGSITYRISVFENETDADNFVYEKYGFMPSSEFPSEIINIEGVRNLIETKNTKRTINGLTFTPNPDGSITVNGTATANTTYQIIVDDTTDTNPMTIEKGNYIISDGVSDYTNYFIQTRIRYSSGTIYLNTGQGAPIGQSIPFEITEPTKITPYIYIRNGVTVENIVFKPKLEKSKVAHSFVPYGSNYLVQKINGKNILNNQNYSLGTISSTTGVDVTSTTLYRFNEYTEIKPNTKIYLLKSLCFVWYDENKNFISYDATYNKEPISPANAKYVRFRIMSSDFATFNNEDYMVSYEPITKYEPYKETLIIYDLQGNWLGKNGTTKDNVEMVSGVLTKKLNQIVFDGSDDEGWVADNINSSKINRSFFTNVLRGEVVVDSVCLCDQLPYDNNIYYDDDEGIYVNWGGSIRVQFDGITTLDELLAKLAENPITVQYILKEPEIIQLEPTEIKLYEGINNIYTESNIDVEEVDITYLTDSILNTQYATKSEVKIAEDNITSSINSRIDDTALGLKQELNTSIQQTANSITNEVASTYATNDEVGSLRNEMSTRFTQTNNTFEMQFKTLNSEVSNIDELVHTNQTTLEKYVRFVDGALELGNNESPISLKIENDMLAFYQNDTKIAYISNNKLYITDGFFTNSLRIDSFGFFKEDNGSLSFGKVG